jgi:5'-nucleotidase (lipoprotein e(P4) family)
MAGCTSGTRKYKKELVSESKLGTLWVQDSGEYRALTYQAYNSAKATFDIIEKGDEIPAVIMDLDETVLDNSAYGAWQALKGESYTPESWKSWCEAREAGEVPGSLDFVKYVYSKGGEVFYISNRKTDVKDATMDNLKALGFLGVDDRHVLLKEKSSNKDGRRKSIEEMGYNIVMLIGDNLDDFDSTGYNKSNEVRKENVDRNRDYYGVKFIILPNPVYGGFEGGIAEGYYRYSDLEKIMLREKKLNVWQE